VILVIDNSIESYWLCPLYSFDYDSESVDFIDGIQIKRITPTFAEYLLAQSHSNFFRTEPHETEWMVSLPYRTYAQEVSSVKIFANFFKAENVARDSLTDLITALKLYHGGRVIAGPLILAEIHNHKPYFGGSTSWTSVSNFWFFKEESIYKLRKSESFEVNSLLQDIRKWREAKILDAVDTALRRLHSSYHGDIEDRIIDQMIAFESLYLGSEQELTYKLASRAAFLLRRRKDHRMLVFNNIKKAYNYRSRIVHGDNPPSRNELRAIVPKTEDYLRQSIRKFLLLLSQGHSLKKLREKLLDENILKNGTLLA
jgi:hypothetical protein